MDVFNFGLSANGDYYIGNPANYGTSTWTVGLHELPAGSANATSIDTSDINALVVQDRCAALCTPTCTANDCGDDGCGGQCNEGLVLYTNPQGVVTDISSSFTAPATARFQPPGGTLGARSVEFCAGEYYGGIQWSYSTTFGATPLSITGQGAGLTILHGNSTGTQATLDFTGGTPEVVVQGITTMDSAFGARIGGGDIALTDVTLSGHGVGIEATSGLLTLTGVYLNNPSNATDTRGMSVLSGAVVTGTDVHFDDLQMTSNSSPAMIVNGAAVSLDSCSIANTTESAPNTIVGATVFVNQGASLNLSNCTLTGNTSARATIVADTGAAVTGTNTTFTGNASPDFIYGVGAGNVGAINVPGPTFTCTSTGCVP